MDVHEATKPLTLDFPQATNGSRIGMRRDTKVFLIISEEREDLLA
jgi:hypothetical protein